METRGAGIVLTIAGHEELTAANADQFRRQVCSALDRHPVVEVDLALTTAMDCAGLGALIAVHNLARRRKRGVRLVGAAPGVQRLFDMMRAGHLLHVDGAPEDPFALDAGPLSPWDAVPSLPGRMEVVTP